MLLTIWRDRIMVNRENSSNRRGFLGKLATGAAAFGATTLIDPLRLIAESANATSPANEKELQGWFGKLKGKHRQVFDCMTPDGGIPLAWARVFLMTNQAVGVSEHDCSAVVILRHESIPLAMEDRLWDKYKFGEFFKISDMMTKAPYTQNVFWKPKPNTLPLPGMAVNELLDSGVLIGVCDMALTVYSKFMADQMKGSAEDIKKDWVSGILPGIQIVPSGVLAINRAQEHGCTYCWAG
jgi:intracellular sulfur oxidation DsrE/DsrF family protein